MSQSMRVMLINHDQSSRYVLKGIRYKSIIPRTNQEVLPNPMNPVFPHVFPIHVMLTPRIPDYHWNVDNFGPIIFLKRLDRKVRQYDFPLYERAIGVYETIKTGYWQDILINGKKTTAILLK